MPRLLRFLLVAVLLVTTLVVPATPNAHSNPRGLLQIDPFTFEGFEKKPLEATDHKEIYFTLESQGVTFNGPKAIDYTNSASVGSGFTHSGDMAIQHCHVVPACDTPLIMKFISPQARVQVWFGVNHRIEEAVEVTFTAFDAEEGGNDVGSESKTLMPTGEERIPIENALGVASASGNNIRRVEVGFSSPADASWLVFDDVSFKQDTEAGDFTETGTELPTECPDDAQPPTLLVNQPKTGSLAQVNEIDFKGSAPSNTSLTEATLTSVGPEGKKSLAMPMSLFEETDPAFAFTAREILLPGLNTLTLNISNCDGMAPASLNVTYEPPPVEPRYEVLGVEVTQAIQNLGNTVTLIAGKRTYVRVYLRVLDSTATLEQVSGILPICRAPSGDPPVCRAGDEGFMWQASIGEATVDALADVTIKRRSLVESLIFEAPLELTTPGSLSLDLGNLSLSPDFACANCDSFAPTGNLITVEFEEAPPVQIRIAHVAYPFDGVDQRPSDLDWKLFRSWLERAYPTSEVSFLADLGDLPFETTPTCGEVNQRMLNAWVNELSLQSTDAFEDSPVRYFALVEHPEEEGDGSIEGCAAVDDPLLDPFNGPPFHPDRFATGIAGFDWPHDWDDDGSFADFYGAHELGHIYGRRHVGTCSTEADIDTSYSPPNGDIGVEDGDFGFDVGDASLDNHPLLPSPIAIAPYEPTTYTDMMTYCKPRWISAHTYEGILDRLPVEAEPAPDVEVGEDDAGESGDDVGVGDTNVVAIAGDVDDVDDVGDPAGTPAAPPASGEVLLVLGTITLPANATPTVEFRPASRLPGTAVIPRDPNGTFSIALEDSQGNILADYPFTPKIYTDTPAGADPTAQLGEVVPWVDGATSIVIKEAGQDIGVLPVTAHAPRVTITAPSGGGTLPPPAVTVRWDATDDDDADVLTYSLLYSTDNGANWRSIASGLKDQQYTVDLADLSGSDAAIFRVIATDGVNTGQDDSDAPFQAPNNAPEVGIITPASGSTYRSAHTVVLVGRATDVEEGDLEGTSLQWSSDIDGTLGEGRSTSAALSPGVHTITLTATDAAGDATSESILVEIGDDDLPVVEWDASQDISSFPDGLFFYGDNERRGEVYTTDGAGTIQPLNTYFTFLHEWSAIVPGSFSGEDALTDLFLYAADTGLGEFYTSDGEGGLTLLSSSKDVPEPATDWEMVVPGNFGGDDAWTDLFFYDRETGRGSFYTSDGDGRLQLLDTTPPFAETWTSIIPGNFGGNDRTDLLFYNAATGLSQFHTSDGQGCLVLLLEDPDWTPGWDQIVPGNFDGNGDWTDLFLSRKDGGKGGTSREYKVYATDGLGTIIEIGQPGQIAPNWTTMIGGDFGDDDTMTDLLFYDAVSGQRVFLATDGAGGLVELSQPATGSAGWDLIVPGRYTGVE